jgi:amidohydrolase
VGRILFVFQPAEEGAGGALQMIEAGLLERYKPDCCAGIHLWSEHPTGTVSVRDGAFMASMDTFEVEVRGKGGHGAVPQSARDPLIVAAQMVVELQTIVSRRVAPEQPAVLTVGQLHAGHAVNIIPDTATFSGSVRTYDVEVQAQIRSDFHRLVEGIASAHGVEAVISYTRTTIPTVNHPEWCTVMRAAAEAVEGAELGDADFRTMASEDMAFFLERCPGVFIFVGAGNDDVGASFPHHHPRFEIDEAALPICVSLLYEFALRATAR